jgi:hypothetical protein
MTDFNPLEHGFKFRNTFRNAPFQATPILGDITTAGLCGGMAYAALDYISGISIPQINYRPASGTLLQRYIYDRQIHSLVPNAHRWIELGASPFSGLRHSEFFRWGLQGFGGGRLQELRERLDRGIPVPLGLWSGGLSGHQVIAYGYEMGRYRGDLGDHMGDLKIFVYDPNYLNRKRTLIPHLSGQYYHYDEGGTERWGAYFADTNYQRRISPEIQEPDLGTNDGLVHELLLHINTGADDLRGGNDNLNITVNFHGAQGQTMTNINRSSRWAVHTTNRFTMRLRRPVPPEDIGDIILGKTFRAGIAVHNWNMESLRITAQGNGVNKILYNKRGTPLKRFTGRDRNYRVPIGWILAELR